MTAGGCHCEERSDEAISDLGSDEDEETVAGKGWGLTGPRSARTPYSLPTFRSINSSIDRNPCCGLCARHFLDKVPIDVIKLKVESALVSLAVRTNNVLFVEGEGSK